MGNSASSLPYSIGKQVSAVSNSGWACHEGNRKSDGATVTVFVAKKPALGKTPVSRSAQPHLTQLGPALHHFSHCKRLRHPHILQVYATLDTDHPSTGSESGAGGASALVPATASSSSKSETGDLIIVTEPCIPLDAWLQTSPPPEQLAWGLEAIVRGLHFLHTSASLAHGNLSPESFVVTPAGDVKLWNFSLATSVTGGLSRHFMDYQGVVTPIPYQSPERQERRWEAIAAAGVHCMDSFALGVLIPHVFGGHIPQPLVKAVQRLQTPNLKMRPRLQPLLKCPVFDTPYQKLQLQLEEFTVQPVEQKIQFWQNLTPTMQAGLLSDALALYKLWPLIKSSIDTICQSDSLRSQDMFRREVLSTLNPMFFIAENYMGDKVNQEIGRTVGTLFTVNDRAIRGFLLQKITFLSQNLDKNALNSSVFEPACSGFSDSSATLREFTLKATLELVPHLTAPNLEKLSRYLVRLQGDPEASIRTNTIVVFSKVAPHLTEISRQKQLLPAINRALKDPFVPCRLAALKTTLKSKEFFEPRAIASRVLPVVTPQLLDASRDVRREAFTLVDDLLFVLRQASESMPDVPASAEGTATVPAPASGGVPTAPVPHKQAIAPAPASAGSSGGYLSGISSWMSSSTKPGDAPQQQQQQRQTVSQSAQQQRQQQQPTTSNYTLAQPLPMAAGVDVSDGWGDGEDMSDGWGDDDLEVSGSGMKTRTTTATATAGGGGNSLFAPSNGTNDDGFFSGFDSKPAKPAGMTMKPSSGSRLAVPKKTIAKPAVTKLAAEEDVDDGWNDF